MIDGASTTRNRGTQLMGVLRLLVIAISGLRNPPPLITSQTNANNNMQLWCPIAKICHNNHMFLTKKIIEYCSNCEINKDERVKNQHNKRDDW